MRRRIDKVNPGDRLAAAIAGASGRPLDAVRAELGAERLNGPPAPPATSSATRVRVPAAIARAEAAEVAAHAEPSEARQRRPGKPRGAERSTSRGAFLTRARERGCPRMDGLDWLPTDFATMRALERSPRRCLEALAALPRVYALRVRRAALAIERVNGELQAGRGLEHIRARRIIALAVVMWRASRTSRRNGMARILVGRTQGMIATLTHNPATLAPYSVSMLFGTQHHGGARVYDCGDVEALERSAALWCHQPPALAVPPRFRGKDRDGNERAFAEYHFTEAAASDALEPDTESELALGLAALEAPPPAPHPPPS